MTTTARPDPRDAPDFLSVEEAAAVLRLGRTAAYQLARRYLATGGADGIPAVRYGKQLRVPRCKLEEHLGGPITWPPTTSKKAGAPQRAPGPRRTRRRTSRPDQPPQLFPL
jgi:excisionase family DNA binding protein